MTGLKPFFSYYGSKWGLAKAYPAPVHPMIVEPFAGSAGYSLLHYQRNVVLVERYPVIAGIWRYLIGASPRDILAIPRVAHVDDLPASLGQEARWLVGMNLSTAITSPRNRTTARGHHNTARRGWSDIRRWRIAAQVERIRHWRVIEGDFTDAPDAEATWFVDPPYVGPAGRHYRFNQVDYPALGQWCRVRRGQTIVCETAAAGWLPFVPLAAGRSAVAPRGQHMRAVQEAVWVQDR